MQLNSLVSLFLPEQMHVLLRDDLEIHLCLLLVVPVGPLKVWVSSDRPGAEMMSRVNTRGLVSSVMQVREIGIDVRDCVHLVPQL